MIALRDGEILDDLCYRGLQLISDPLCYRFTSDSVLLANIVRANASARVVDLCAGGGIITLLVKAKTRAKEVIGVEIQPRMAELARRSLAYNGMEEGVRILQADLIGIEKEIGTECYDAVVCNPPYYPIGTGEIRENECVAIARHEICVTLADVAETAARLLKFGGKFYLIHRAERLAELFAECRARRLTPKTLYTVSAQAGGDADIVMIEAKKGAAEGLRIRAITHSIDPTELRKIAGADCAKDAAEALG